MVRACWMFVPRIVLVVIPVLAIGHLTELEFADEDDDEGD